MTAVQTLSTRVLADLRLAKRDDDLIEIMTDFTSGCGYAAFQLAPGPHNPTPDPTALLAFGSYNLNWKRQYATEPSCRHDPARAQAILRAGSVQWRRVFATVRDPDQRDFVARAREQGFKDGVTTPIHGPQGCVAIMMFAAAHTIDLDGEDEEALSHIAMALHQRVRRIAAAAIVGMPPPVRLTAREIECLHWVLEGKTNWEIGVLTGVTARTVQFHLGNAARKLDVTNRVQAAVKALVRGDLTISGLAHPDGVTHHGDHTANEKKDALYSPPSKYCTPLLEAPIALAPRF
jgi:LuxR family transcriptional regulator, activator of conjugal transfer of Ti plasmids